MKNNQKSNVDKGAYASLIGLIGNLFLAITKIIVGILTGFVSVMADGFNNLSDSGSGVVSLISFRISKKPADKEHPFGHRRAEYISAMVTGFFVVLLAFELIRESIEKIGDKTSAVKWFVYLTLGLSIGVKLGMFILYKITSAKYQSEILKASATDSLCDCIATFTVIVGLLIYQFTGFRADAWAGILIGLFIVWQGGKILLDASSKLLGQAPDKNVVELLKIIIKSHSQVLGYHDLRVFGYGKGVNFATVHIEMDADLPALASHEVIDKIEQEVADSLNIVLTTHLDPIDLNDSEKISLEERVREILKGLSSQYNLHDFRLIRGVRKKVVFEVALPYSVSRDTAEVQKEIENALLPLDDYEFEIVVERQ